VVLLLVNGAATAPAPIRAPTAPDLALVPESAHGFITARLADVWKIDLVRKTMRLAGASGGTDPAEEIRKALGLPVEEIERLTYVLEDVNNNKVWAVAYTSRPYDRKAVLGKFADRREIAHAGLTFYVRNPGDVAMYFVSDRVIVYGPEAGMKAFLSFHTGRKRTGPLREALKRAQGKRHLVAGFNPPPKEWKTFRAGAAAATGVMPLETALDFRSAVLSLHHAAPSRLEVTLDYPDARTAKKARVAIEAARDALQRMLPALEKAANGKAPAAQVKQGVGALRRALASVVAVERGATVSLSGKIDLEGLSALVLPAPGKR
jgi:hypothetical protein